MALRIQDIDFLRGARGREVLAACADCDTSEPNRLALLSQLRQTLSPDEAAAILTTLILRQRAGSKFGDDAGKMLFTADALQQASQPRISQYRAGQIESDSVLDLCCGIGADSVAFARSGKRVLGLDIDPVRIAIARHNAAALGLSARFHVAEARDPLPAGHACVFYDPSRRDSQGQRIGHVERYLPPLSLVRRWRARELVVKLSPAVDRGQLAGYPGQLEFVSLEGRLSEALLWLHRPAGPPIATRLDAAGAHRLTAPGGAVAPIGPPKGWLLEPDPAILRAGLTHDLALDLSASLLDERIAYMTLERPAATPWGRQWQILDWMPFQLKRLRRYLAERGVGEITVKKRGFPMTPEQLIQRLRLKRGGESRVLVMTRHGGRAIAIICRPPGFGQNERIPYNEASAQTRPCDRRDGSC